ncbi:MAG: TlpA family protein disulfide reductase [Desulfovibrionaceae bacterium]
MNQMKKAALRLCLVLMLVACSGSPAESEVQRLDADGLLQRIAEAKGKVVLINFWATWCPGCLQEIPELVKLRKAYDEDELLVIGASVDESRGKLQRYLAKRPVNYPMYQAASEASMLYGVRSIPLILIYNPKGELMVKHEGFAPFDQLQAAVGKLFSP